MTNKPIKRVYNQFKPITTISFLEEECLEQKVEESLNVSIEETLLIPTKN